MIGNRRRDPGGSLMWILEALFVLALTVVFLVVIAHGALTVWFANSGLRPGISFLGIEIGGESEEAVREKIPEIIETTFRDPVLLEKDGTVFFLHYGDHYRLSVDVEGLLAKAKALDKDKDIWERARQFLEADFEPVELPWQPVLDRTFSEEALARLLEEAGDGQRVQAFPLPDGKVRLVTTAAKEQHLAILEQLEDTCRRLPYKNPRILQTQPASLKGTETVVDPADPKLGFANVVGSARTRYDAANTAWASNMALALGKLEGRILNPGEAFDFLALVGPAGAAAGYQPARLDASLTPGPVVGAGIDQVASTAFQALVKAGARVVSRTAHPYFFKALDYTVLGLDVRALGGGSLVLENPWTFPLRLKVSQTGQEIGIDVTSTQILPGTIELRVGVPEKVPYKTELVQDPNLPRNVEVVEQEGLDGYRVKVFRKLTRTDGHAGREELLGDQVIDYAALSSRIRVGVGDPDHPPATWNERSGPLPPPPSAAPPQGPDLDLGVEGP